MNTLRDAMKLAAATTVGCYGLVYLYASFAGKERADSVDLHELEIGQIACMRTIGTTSAATVRIKSEPYVNGYSEWTIDIEPTELIEFGDDDTPDEYTLPAENSGSISYDNASSIWPEIDGEGGVITQSVSLTHGGC